jgi:hypothetical protein
MRLIEFIMPNFDAFSSYIVSLPGILSQRRQGAGPIYAVKCRRSSAKAGHDRRSDVYDQVLSATCEYINYRIFFLHRRATLSPANLPFIFNFFDRNS